MLGYPKTPHPTTRRALCLILIGLLSTACGGVTPAKTYTIGVVNYVASLDQVLPGFKAKMAALGYVEGKNVTYLYHGVLEPEPQVIEREVKSLMNQKIDLFLALGTRPALEAKKAVEGTKIPVVFAPVVTPVKEGLVESLSRPGGNVTGVQNGETIPKALEWLHTLVPQATKVHAFYHPQDQVALTALKPLPAIAASLGVDLVLDEVHNLKEATAAIATLPKDTAIFLVPVPNLEPVDDLIEVAVQRGIPVGTSVHMHLPAGALVGYAGSFPAMGEQAARLVDQILKGTKPADLPVETAESFLRINLKIATAMSLDIPDELLRQADTVLR